MHSNPYTGQGQLGRQHKLAAPSWPLWDREGTRGVQLSIDVQGEREGIKTLFKGQVLSPCLYLFSAGTTWPSVSKQFCSSL